MPWKNSTLTMLPSRSEASAFSLMDDCSSKLEPVSGLVRLTEGFKLIRLDAYSNAPISGARPGKESNRFNPASIRGLPDTGA